MPLQPGDKLGPYALIVPTGKGEMGEVWKARDTRLDRLLACVPPLLVFTFHLLQNGLAH